MCDPRALRQLVQTAPLTNNWARSFFCLLTFGNLQVQFGSMRLCFGIEPRVLIGDGHLSRKREMELTGGKESEGRAADNDAPQNRRNWYLKLAASQQQPRKTLRLPNEC